MSLPDSVLRKEQPARAVYSERIPPNRGQHSDWYGTCCHQHQFRVADVNQNRTAAGFKPYKWNGVQNGHQ